MKFVKNNKKLGDSNAETLRSAQRSKKRKGPFTLRKAKLRRVQMSLSPELAGYGLRGDHFRYLDSWRRLAARFAGTIKAGPGRRGRAGQKGRGWE